MLLLKSRIKIILWVIFAVLLLGVILFAVSLFQKDKINDAAIVKQIRTLNRWETSSFSIEKIIDNGSTGNIFQKFLFGNRILLIAHGEVIGGFDLSGVTENDVTINGTAITIELPAPQILTASLDETQTRVYDRQKGLLVATDDNLETEARQQAIESLREAACTQGILNITSENARKQLTSILASFGFVEISINIPAGSC